MTDLTSAIEPKSDQLNADDLLAGPRTITITRVTKKERGAEQPVSVHFEDDNGKPWKPCKSMARVLVALWGKNGDAYVGRAVTLYCDPSVRWGGQPVGGIRISHMSDIARESTIKLTVTKGNKAPYTVKPLETERPASRPQALPAGGASATRDAASQEDGEVNASAAETSPPPPASFLFTLTDPKTGAMRTTTDGKAWADHLAGQIAKRPFDQAKALYEANKAHVALALEGGDEARGFAVQVSSAWNARE